MFPEDKLAHSLGGWAIAATVMLMGHPLWHAAVVVFGIGCLKELYDFFHPDKHSCDPLDLLATCAGILPVIGIQIFYTGI